ncbi:hypothetical protein ACFPH6_06645 [Streptomyces xiangluensis]|uniref:Uncharacterized protein n=1 Tax=Streptomyces xiangluensis TaxID=2665720 RepID=A0ABV8YG31_9ACTN
MGRTHDGLSLCDACRYLLPRTRGELRQQPSAELASLRALLRSGVWKYACRAYSPTGELFALPMQVKLISAEKRATDKDRLATMVRLERIRGESPRVRR